MGLNLQQVEVHRGKLKVTTLSALIHYFHEKWALNLSNYLFQGRTIYIRAYDRWWKWREIFPFHLYFCYGTSPNYGKNLQQYFKNQKKKKTNKDVLCMCTWTIVKLQSLASLYWGKLVSVEITWVTRSLM